MRLNPKRWGLGGWVLFGIALGASLSAVMLVKWYAGTVSWRPDDVVFVEETNLRLRQFGRRWALAQFEDPELGARCPTVAELVDAGLVPPEQAVDAAGRPLEIACEGERPQLLSVGFDGARGTADDLTYRGP